MQVEVCRADASRSWRRCETVCTESADIAYIYYLIMYNVGVKVRIDKSSRLPIGDQLQTQIRLLIQEGELEPLEGLPTTHELATRVDVNPNTVASAYRALETEGWLETRRRGGTRVAALPPVQAEQRLRNALASDLAERVTAAGIDTEAMLALLHAHVSLRAERSDLRVAALAHTPHQAATLAERLRTHLGRGTTVTPLTLLDYHAAEHHYAVVDADLLSTLRGTMQRPTAPLADASPWRYGSEFPAGAD
jgi:GntR family transcriptional regulator